MPLSSSNKESEKISLYGTLFIVATPIGNLNDITLRAINTLEEVDIVAAEDTRLTKKLLSHLNIRTRLISYHEHNEDQSALGIIEKLKTGSSVALVSTAGTPTISDPGFRLLTIAIREKIKIIPIPGVSAAITALSVSGMPSDMFTFVGFLPSKKKKQHERLEKLACLDTTLIFYESPKRVLSTMKEMLKIMGDRYTVLSREMTKTYEEFLRGTFSELIADLGSRPSIKGEITLLVSGEKVEQPFNFDAIRHDVLSALKKDTMGISAIAKKFAKSHGVPKNMLYNKILELKEGIDQANDGLKGDNENGQT